MADIFLQADARSLLRNKFLLLVGDSNTRALYKDLVWLIQCGTLVDDHHLRRKMEYSFLGDELVSRSELHRGRDYKEVRHFEKYNIKIHYHFITRCYNKDVEDLFVSFKSRQRPPDVVFYNSLLWDISRWGPDGVTKYKENMVRLMDLMKSCLPEETLVVWGTTLPISSDVRSHGFLIKQIEFLKHTLRFEVMEGNHFAHQLVASYGYDVLDLHYHIRMQVHRRYKDGVHYTNLPVRQMVNLILTHIGLAWNCILPGNFASKHLKKLKNNCSAATETLESKTLEEITNLKKLLGPSKNVFKSHPQKVKKSFPRNDNSIDMKMRRGKKKRRYQY